MALPKIEVERKPMPKAFTGTYSEEWMIANNVEAAKSAQIIVPLILSFVHPQSIVDVGCSYGTWLYSFMEHGIYDVLGIDNQHINKERLKIPESNFLAHDLTKEIKIGRQFDLVISLEVAEHLPPENAENFVKFLTQLGPIIYFSAAIPRQVGLNHVNGQWPDFWSGLFRKRGFVTIDCIRKIIWDNKDVGFWYKQNSLFFVKEFVLTQNPVLKIEYENTALSQLNIIHPDCPMI